MNSSVKSEAVPPQVVRALSELNGTASAWERDAKSAAMVGDSRASDELLSQALALRSQTAVVAEALVEGAGAPFQALQLDFRRSIGNLHLTCGILAIRLGDWSTAREHGLRALHFDGSLKVRVLTLLVTADVSEGRE